MAYTPQENYQATEVRTAPPQKLQLMLIEAALALANRAKNLWSEGRNDYALKSLMHAQNILAGMMSSVDIDGGGDVVQKVLAIDEFIYRNLVRAGCYRDERALADAIRVLERERDNWRIVCAKLNAVETAAPKSGATMRGPHFSLLSDFEAATQGGFSVEA